MTVSPRRRPGRRHRPGALTAALTLAFASIAWASDPVAVLTEVRKGRGEVRVRSVGEDNWKPPQPLMSLEPGDQIRASEDARAVIVLSGGGTRIVSSGNSPFVVASPGGAAGGETARTMVSSVTQFLLGKQRQPAYVRLTARSGVGGTRVDLPLILSPRETRLPAGPVTFAWSGPESLRYSIRLFGPDGIVWSASDLPRRSVAYPRAAPALTPGVRYVWELGAPGHPADRAQFELVPDTEMGRIHADLALLRPETSGYPRSTAAIIRAGRMYQEGLFQKALDELLESAATDPQEPTLREMIGHLYDRIGLRREAAQAFATARALAGADR